MDPQTGKKNTRKIIYGAVLLLLILVICVLVLSGISKERARSEVTRPSAVNTASAEIAPRSGGSIPTKIPTVTPTPLTGMESPLFCMLEMSMIHGKAEKLGGSGMLIPDRYDQSSKTCSFIIRGGKLLSEIGKISTIHTSEEDYGVRIEISESAGLVKNEQMKLWGTAALLALENELSQEEAEKLMDAVIGTGTAAWGVYDLTLKENPLTKTSSFSVVCRD
ncbi:MAG: hypothetical protein IJI07_02970 [Flexilinea sp.]|nr:hypothetical protein [Flexilinea sp.]